MSHQNATAVCEIFEAWAAAVRRRDIPAILENHAADLVMFDVPPPFKSIGLDAYRKTWEMFYSWTSEPIPFEAVEMTATAGDDVAFVVATMHCAEPGPDGTAIPLEFRLTVGLEKFGDRRLVTHEHHSIPSG